MNRISIPKIEAFVWTATLGSVGRAADHLHLSQPTISLRLKALEETMQSPLFDRIGRGLKLTIDGEGLLPRAREILERVRQIEGDAGGCNVGGHVRIGCAEGFALLCLPAAMRLLHERYPQIRPEFTVATSAAIEPELSEHRLDLAFLVNPNGPEDFMMLPLGTQETSWIAADDWDLPDVVRPRDLVHLPIISNQATSIGYRQIRAWFASAGLAPSRLDTCSSVAMLAHLVAAGTALAILPKKLAGHGVLNRKVKVLFSSPQVEDVPIFATFHSESQSPNIKAVVEIFREVLAGMDYLHQ